MTTPHHQNTGPTHLPPQKKGGTQKRVNTVTAVHSGRETPGPIPNPEAKPASADDTTHPGGKVGHRRTHLKTGAPQHSWGAPAFVHSKASEASATGRWAAASRSWDLRMRF